MSELWGEQEIKDTLWDKIYNEWNQWRGDYFILFIWFILFVILIVGEIYYALH